MQISLIIIQSINGIIARTQEDNLEWGSKLDRELFTKLTTKADTMIMGSSTYVKMPSTVFETRKGFVFTSQPEKFESCKNVTFFKGSAVEGVKYLENIGIQDAALIGGGHISQQFLEAGLIDEIYVTIAPYIFSGVKAFADFTGEIKLKLLQNEPLGEGEILLHYAVLR